MTSNRSTHYSKHSFVKVNITSHEGWDGQQFLGSGQEPDNNFLCVWAGAAEPEPDTGTRRNKRSKLGSNSQNTIILLFYSYFIYYIIYFNY